MMMVRAGKRVAIYTRVSTKSQDTENQLPDLQAWASRAGCEVVATFEDKGISGSKGRDKRPAFDAMLKSAVRREFDVLAVWSSDRLGRSMSHLIEVLQTIKDTGIGLYIHTQGIDTTTPAGRALYQMLGVFAEFEREMIVARVNAGLDRVKAELNANGSFKSRNSGEIRKRLGRPGKVTDAKLQQARKELQSGKGILKVAKLVGLGTGTVHRLKREMEAQKNPN